jgi:hypothetical protein
MNAQNIIDAKRIAELEVKADKQEVISAIYVEGLIKSSEEIETLEAELEKLNELLETRTVPLDTPEIVCLCGSTRFMDAFFDAGWYFTLKGYIVLSVGVCKHAKDHGGEALGQEVADMLDELHLKKIDLADFVYVLNVDGYIGESTAKEVEYAKAKNKPIQYLEPIALPKENNNGK